MSIWCLCCWARAIRYFDNLGDTAAEFHRAEVVEGDGVTHLRYHVTYR
jgi:hypothetical protein